MTAPRIAGPTARFSLISVALIAAGAALVGAALDWRGADHDPALLSEMAAEPVKLSTGAQLHVQKYEVTVAEWNICHDRGGCTLRLRARRARPARDPGHRDQPCRRAGIPALDQK